MAKDSIAARARKEQKRKLEKLRKAQIKEMRKYSAKLKSLDLRKALTPSQKSYVKKAWDEYQNLTVRPTKVYKTKDKKKLKAAQRLSQHSGAIKWDVAFLPSPDPKATVKFKKDRVVLSTKYVDIENIEFDLQALVTDPESEINRALNSSPEAVQFIIMAGEHLFNGGLSRSMVPTTVLQLIERYSPGGTGYEKRGPNSYFANWLFGLKAFYTKDQKSVREFRKAYSRAAQENKANKRAGRRKRKATYGAKD